MEVEILVESLNSGQGIFHIQIDFGNDRLRFDGCNVVVVARI